ncbi:hypothetical protein [Aureimonas sp. N4]|uniref:hypothetical protein n=1 Tax=Aureimonas sp. N4 TaxID=1638165 RepID=UPI0012E35097|nr:hypothetical protein [Aureimonas sp. N4]
MPANPHQLPNASSRPVSGAPQELPFVNSQDRKAAFSEFSWRLNAFLQQGFALPDAIRRALASFDPYLVSLIKADPLIPGVTLYKNLSKRTIKQDASNDGQVIKGRDVLRWWDELRKHRRETGRVIVAVTVRLSAKIEAKALAQPQPCDWLRRRVREHVGSALGYRPAGIFGTGIKSTAGDALHLHSLIAVSLDELDDLKLALQKVGGTVSSGFREYQVKIVIAPTAGSLEYLIENAEEKGLSGRVRGRTLVVSKFQQSDQKPGEPEVARKAARIPEEASAVLDPTAAASSRTAGDMKLNGWKIRTLLGCESSIHLRQNRRYPLHGRGTWDLYHWSRWDCPGPDPPHSHRLQRENQANHTQEA